MKTLVEKNCPKFFLKLTPTRMVKLNYTNISRYIEKMPKSSDPISKTFPVPAYVSDQIWSCLAFKIRKTGSR